MHKSYMSLCNRVNYDRVESFVSHRLYMTVIQFLATDRDKAEVEASIIIEQAQ